MPLPAQNVGAVVRKRLADGTYMYEDRAQTAALAHAHAMPSPIAAANEAEAAGAARPVEEERAADEVRGPRVPSPRGRRRIVRRTFRCSTLAAAVRGPGWSDRVTSARWVLVPFFPMWRNQTHFSKYVIAFPAAVFRKIHK